MAVAVPCGTGMGSGRLPSCFSRGTAPLPSPAEGMSRSRRLYVVDLLLPLVPGTVLVAAAVTAAFWVSRTLPGVSPAAAAVAGGIALANLGGLRDSFRPGLRLASRRMLRLAIVLLGLQIALPEVLALGGRTLALVAVATGVTFAVTRWAGPRLGVDARRSLLIATGVSVCGAAAIAAMHEVAGSDDDDAASAVGVVVLYGSAAIVVLPALGGLLDLSPHQLGLWAGAAVHEVAQVAAIGAAAGTGVLAGAVVVKLARVLLLAPIVALTSAGLRRAATRQARRAALARTGESRGAADARGSGRGKRRVCGRSRRGKRRVCGRSGRGKRRVCGRSRRGRRRTRGRSRRGRRGPGGGRRRCRRSSRRSWRWSPCAPPARSRRRSPGRSPR
nr:hypothetical protein GCM10020093_036660 [Planobispora longispora]